MSGQSARPGPARRQPVTYKDLQRHTGLSLATISKYFNGLPVRESNRIAVEAAASELGYRVNTVARSLRTQRSRTVGVLLPALNNDFHLSVIAGVEAALREEGVGMIVSASRGERSPDDGAVDFLAGRMVDGIIAVPTVHDAPALVQASGQGLPIVLVDRLVDGLEADAVVLDNPDAARQAVQHLTDHGHRRISAVGGPAEIWSLRGRRQGFLQALEHHDLDAGPGAVVSGPLTVESGRASMRALLARQERPTAVFCFNQELTVGALIAINESGLDIPGDISFVGFDTSESAQVTRPRLSMMVQPVHDIATRAAALMARRLDADAPGGEPQQVVLPAELVPGGSVARPRT